jgi:hypothetical protein
MMKIVACAWLLAENIMGLSIREPAAKAGCVPLLADTLSALRAKSTRFCQLDS